jgi:hypothetical protein
MQNRSEGGLKMVASPVKVAVLDDYQNVALQMTDWSPLQSRATVTVFNDHISDPDLLVERLAPFEVVCVMRERTPLPRAILERLPNLKLIAQRRSATRRLTPLPPPSAAYPLQLPDTIPPRLSN